MARGYRLGAVGEGKTIPSNVLYDSGDENTSVTGGYSTSGYSYALSFDDYPGNCVKGENSITVTAPTAWRSGAVIGTNNLLDLSDYSTIKVYTNVGIKTLDISSITSGYFAITAYCSAEGVRGTQVAIVTQKNDSGNHNAVVVAGGTTVIEVIKVIAET